VFSGIASFIALNRALGIFLAILAIAIVFASGYFLSLSRQNNASKEIQKLLAAEIANLKSQIAKLKRKL
jgi:preprotein translocase subunit YajC